MSERMRSDDGAPQPAVTNNPERRFDTEEDEINLLDLALVIAKNKRMILALSFMVAVLVAGVSLLIPNKYRADVVMVAAQSSDSKSGGLASALGGLGGLASLAGVSLGGGGSVEENLAVLRSRDFLWQFAQQKQLLPILFEDQWDASRKTWIETEPALQPGPFDLTRKLIEGGVLSISKDDKTGLITLSIEWKDAALASQWANDLVTSLNKYLAERAIVRSQNNLQYLNETLMSTQVEDMRKTLYDLMASEQKSAMLASAQKDFAFRVLDPALTPDKKASPKRAIMVILAGLVAFFLAMILAFLREGMQQAGKDSTQQERLRQLKQALRWKDGQ